LRLCVNEVAGGVMSRTGVLSAAGVAVAALGVEAFGAVTVGGTIVGAALTTGGLASQIAALAIVGAAASVHKPDQPVGKKGNPMQRLGVLLPVIAALSGGIEVHNITTHFLTKAEEATLSKSAKAYRPVAEIKTHPASSAVAKIPAP
jgi:hypothetical protein